MSQNNTPNNIESLQIEVNRHRAHYIKGGKGAPVVLVHGGASDSREWEPIITQFQDRFCFYAPDLPGFGKSDRDPKGYYLSDFSNFLAGFIQQLKLDRPVLIGHSFGARTCLDTAIRPESNFSKLILIDASGLGKMSPLGGVLFYSFKWIRDILRKPQPFPRFLSREGDDWDNVQEQALRNIKIPTLIIWKRTDPYLPLAYAQCAQRLIPGARLEVIEGYGHAPHQQNDKSAFYRLMGEFLEGKI